MNDARRCIAWTIIALVLFAGLNWLSDIIQIKLAIKQPVGDYLWWLVLLFLFSLLPIYKTFRLGMKIIYTQSFLNNHELLASMLVGFLLVMFAKPTQLYEDFIIFTAGLIVMILAFIKAGDTPLPQKEKT